MHLLVVVVILILYIRQVLCSKCVTVKRNRKTVIPRLVINTFQVWAQSWFFVVLVTAWGAINPWLNAGWLREESHSDTRFQAEVCDLWTNLILWLAGFLKLAFSQWVLLRTSLTNWAHPLQIAQKSQNPHPALLENSYAVSIMSTSFT